MNNWKHWAEIIGVSFAIGALSDVVQVLQSGHVPTSGPAIGASLLVAGAAGVAQVRRTMAGVKWGVALAIPDASTTTTTEITKP